MQNQIEVWKHVKGYEGFYQVSNLGIIKSCKRLCKSKTRTNGANARTIREKELRPETTKNGYLRVTFSNNRLTKRKSVHRLVAETFIDNTFSKPCVNHINGKKSDNRVINLEWCTHSENERHSYNVLGKTYNRKNKTKL